MLSLHLNLLADNGNESGHLFGCIPNTIRLITRFLFSIIVLEVTVRLEIVKVTRCEVSPPTTSTCDLLVCLGLLFRLLANSYQAFRCEIHGTIEKNE